MRFALESASLRSRSLCNRGVDVKCTEAGGKSYVLFVGKFLVAKENALMFDPGIANFLNHLVLSSSRRSTLSISAPIMGVIRQTRMALIDTG